MTEETPMFYWSSGNNEERAPTLAFILLAISMDTLRKM
jgi:hypothetical protein